MANNTVAKPRRSAKPRRTARRVCVLPESLTIRGSGEFVVALREACNAGVPELDGSAVAEADTAGMQTLAAVAALARQSGGSLAWSGASPALVATAATLGLSDYLGLPAVSAGTDLAPG